MVGFTRTSFLAAQLCDSRVAATNDQILAKKDADGKEKVSKSEDEWDSCVDKNGHRDSRIWPAGDNNDN